jgi:protoporphyrin/coproporphyrin ferrochelatase
MNIQSSPSSHLPAHTAPMQLPADHVPVKTGKIGVLLMNLGTPEGTSFWPMRRYLREFLEDRRVIETSRWIWWPVLNLIILTIRPGKKGKDYAKIWNNERNEGPLKTITRDQSDNLASHMSALHQGRVIVDWAMRYGLPDVKSRIQSLQDQGCERILLVPLYPQYAAPTSGTACDQAFRVLMQMRWQPAVRVVPPYHDDPAYIDALARSIRAHLATLDHQPDAVVCSFHGMPKSYLVKGDPYFCHCAKTHRLLAEKLGWSTDKLVLTFQSRFGPEEWLQPYTDKTVEAMAQRGVKKIAMISPGFSADCLETLEELDVENREIFMKAGGTHFSYIPCLNATPDGMAVINAVVERELQGWL